MTTLEGTTLTRDPRYAVAGLSMKGGQKENFFLSLLQYFPQYDRWSLTKLTPVKDYSTQEDHTLGLWVKEHDLRHLVLDFPLTTPVCQQCELLCPGLSRCEDLTIEKQRKKIKDILKKDEQLYLKNPKEYEEKRLEREKITVNNKKNNDDFLSKSFKRRLKKGIIPYWHRCVDLWVWFEYYDIFLDFFKTSFDSLGTASLMLINRFAYMRRHLPHSVKLWESDTRVILLGLLEKGIIRQRYLRGLYQLDEAHLARKAIIKNIEKHLSLFIYEHDQKVLENNPKAFDAFILALGGVCQQMDKVKKAPTWASGVESFIMPHF